MAKTIRLDVCDELGDFGDGSVVEVDDDIGLVASDYILLDVD